MTGPIDTSELTVLGQTVRGPIEHLECFTAPEHVTTVRFSSDELMSLCPVTGQPDLSSLIIEYRPDGRCVESKSLKLYLWSFRDRKVFCEALAAEIADEVVRAADPAEVRVTVTQRPRGGIVIEATAERRKAP
jgi:7-cyano-7-deazaguanine reductase